VGAPATNVCPIFKATATFSYILLPYRNALPSDGNSALLFSSDFYYPDGNGIKRKTILCKPITVAQSRKT
jgi:hypothetical protein